MASTTYAWTTFSQLGKTRSTPRPGDLIFYRKNEGGQLSSTKMGHVGIVTSTDGSAVTSVEGNLSDRVMEVRHSTSDPAIAGYVRLAGGGLKTLLLIAGVAAGTTLVARRVLRPSQASAP